ncbi:DUF3309 family protein [Enterobacter sp. SECR19-1250]|uniref:type 4 pilus major pilin n=1 Tax=Enterobacter sp. SECR19-1250 TaxID=2749084 RepID=UPI0015B5BE66|nr:type 4 pilus major pilin [Enterobacter sp. SECR19-1250]NWJ78855.1 DUF3309 family protein [Enterobacter sp. SECR19-1250]
MELQSQHIAAHPQTQPSTKHHRGWGFLEQGGVGLVVLFVIAIVLAGYFLLKGRVNVGSESSNIQTIITSTQNLMKGSDGYTFSSGEKMMGSLIQMGAVPRSMTVRGTPSSGTATLYNTWGGAVTLAPVATSGFTNGFTLTYERVPQSECIQLATQLSKAAIANAITLNSTSHADGKVSTEEASAQCTADSGSTGTNKLIFTVNG